jgi:hypothetical protein
MMGDRCSLRITVLKKDYEDLLTRIGEDVDPDLDNLEGDAMECAIDDVNGGAYAELKLAGEAGLVFIVEQGRGDDYDGGTWASSGDGDPVFQPTDVDGVPVVHVGEDGPHPDDVERAKKFFAQLRKAKKLLWT